MRRTPFKDQSMVGNASVASPVLSGIVFNGVGVVLYGRFKVPSVGMMIS